MLLKEKEKFVDELTESLKKAESLIVASYQGLDVNSVTELRRKLKGVNCRMKVIKNRLGKRALKNLNDENYSEFAQYLTGPTAVLMAGSDPTNAVKVFKKYVEENKLMEFKAGIINGMIVTSKQIDILSTLPSREVLIAKAVNVINAPIQGLYNSLSGVITRFLFAVKDLAKKIEKGEIKTKGQEKPAEEPVSAAQEKEEEAAPAAQEAAAEADGSAVTAVSVPDSAAGEVTDQAQDSQPASQAAAESASEQAETGAAESVPEEGKVPQEQGKGQDSGPAQD
ncbi:MAG: 50S ribosomal protein L10 [Elusimicrobia bacterium]|nr:50S ribosomal protein L10 [Elusimicrobiota bacterium]